ncbi:hypothetical protein F5X96DRAFT_624844, partial [Biscogniauxia mediterranea]
MHELNNGLAGNGRWVSGWVVLYVLHYSVTTTRALGGPPKPRTTQELALSPCVSCSRFRATQGRTNASDCRGNLAITNPPPP